MHGRKTMKEGRLPCPLFSRKQLNDFEFLAGLLEHREHLVQIRFGMFGIDLATDTGLVLGHHGEHNGQSVHALVEKFLGELPRDA